MAGVTDTIFRQLCKEHGADVMVTEFVSAEGIFRRNERTLEYLEFDEAERPVGVQLFGGDPEHLGEAARMVVGLEAAGFHRPEFRLPGEQGRLEERRLLAAARLSAAGKGRARRGAGACAPLPVTAKIRIGWSEATINAATTARILEDCGIAAIAVHGRTKEQGYSGEADWDVIAQVAAAVRVPVIGNGDLASARDVAAPHGHRRARRDDRPRRDERAVDFPRDQTLPRAPASCSRRRRWKRSGRTSVRHCRSKARAPRRARLHAMHSMRSRLMAYSRGMPEAKRAAREIPARRLALRTRRHRRRKSRRSNTALALPAFTT